MIGNKKSIFATYGTDPVADTTAPAYRPVVEAPVEMTETGMYGTEYEDAELCVETYRLLYQIRTLLFVLVVLKLICLIKN